MSDERVRLLTQFVETNLLADQGQQLAPDAKLLGDGLVDSMGLVLLAAFVEERFGVRLDDADLREGGVDTIAEIAALIESRR